MLKFKKLFGDATRSKIIGMVHVDPLPGTPNYKGNVKTIVENALSDASTLLHGKVDSILVENMHDVPYVQAKYLKPETTAVMTKICNEIKKLAKDSIPLGVQILACGNCEALAVAQAAGFHFIRAEGFVFGHLADEGYTDANAGTLLRYRKHISAEDIIVFTDIKKKHSSHAVTADVSLEETAHAAEFFLSDGLVLTGTATGSPASPKELADLKKSSKLPILVGSGVTLDNYKQYEQADAFIIGSHFKRDGCWQNEVDQTRVTNLMTAIST